MQSVHGTPFSFDGNSFCGYIVLTMADYKRTFEVLILLLVSSLGFAAELPALQPTVEAEEDVYRFAPANNGAGPYSGALSAHGFFFRRPLVYVG